VERPEPRGVVDVAVPEPLLAPDHRRPRDPPLPAPLHDRRVQRPALPLLGRLDVDGQLLPRQVGEHGSPPHRRPKIRWAAVAPRTTPRNPTAMLPSTL